MSLSKEPLSESRLSENVRAENSRPIENQAQQDIGGSQNQAVGQMSGGQAINISGGSVYFQDSQGRSLEPAMKQKREIPSLLPYLLDRTDQEFELGQAIQVMQAQSARHPLLCVVHGDEWQSHDKFLERLRKVSLPRLMRLNLQQTAIKEYHLQWPASLKKLDKLPDRLTRNLADEVKNDSFATIQDINRTFGQYPGPVLVHLHLMTEDWKRLGFGLLPKVLEFWQNWPKLGADQTLIICVFIKYQQYRVKQSAKRRKRWRLLNPFAWLKRFLKVRRCQKLNSEIAQHLEALAKTEFNRSDQLIGVVLPKLDNIGRSHVEEWVRCKETVTFVGEAVAGQLFSAVRKMFDQDETLPMDRIAESLIRLLKDTAVREKEL